MSKFSGVNRVIFDLDNTLIKHDFEKENIRISKYLGLENNDEFKKQFDYMFKSNGIYLKDTIVTEGYFVTVMEKLMPILKDIGITGKELLDIIDKYHAGTLMEGAKEILEYLYDKGYQIVAFTNWFGKYQLKILKKLGIDQYFERIYGWDNYFAKPNYFAMLRALENTDPNQNVMIGDNLRDDVILPKSVGVKTIGFNINYSNQKNNIKADADITRLIEIKKYL